ncbi:MAG: sensor histidine kinase [Bacteriovoracaceae bacterium]
MLKRVEMIEGERIAPRYFRAILLQATVLPIALSLIIAVFFVQQIYKVLEENEQVRRSDLILNHSAQAFRMIVDTETGLRGFIISGNEIYLEPWIVSTTSFDVTFSKLLILVKDRPNKKKELTEIFFLYNEWVKQAERNITMRREFQQSKKIEAYDLQKELMDQIRDRFDAFYKSEQSIRRKQWLESDTSAKRTLFIILFTAFILGLAIAFFFWRQLKRLTNNYSGAISELTKASESLEETVAQRTNELMLANKELEAFSYSVSHDLRAPLRGIDGFSQILIEDYSSKLDGEALRYLNFIRQGVQKMGILIDDLINLSRLTRSEFRKEEVDLSQVAADIMGDLKCDSGNRKYEFQNFETEIVIGDAGLLRAALQNLLSNAWKYTSKNVLTKIELGKIEKDGRKVYFVRDNGVGFDMRFYDKLFQPFQRLHPKDKFDGTGIGLATVSRIIARHQGIIWAESEIGEGTTFYFTLNA